MLKATYHFGTDRIVAPELTWQHIQPLLQQCGITRCTSVTRLDTLGIPTYCSIRPDGRVLQVSNGKGLSDIAAKVSAAMEALELYHAENPLPEKLHRCSLEDLQAAKDEVLLPKEIQGFYNAYFGDRYRLDWTQGENLMTGKNVWAPASGIYFYCTPSLHNTGSNGLASGNHLIEATLHAVYELIERDAMSRIFIDGKLRLHEQTINIDPASIDAVELQSIFDKAEQDHTKIVLLSLNSVIPMHTFWAIFLNRDSMVSGSTFNIGWGTHINKHIAASRALTEAAQSRLGFIHGARDDLLNKPVSKAKNVQQSNAFEFFNNLDATGNWRDIKNDEKLTAIDDLDELLSKILVQLEQAGHNRALRFDLTRPEIGVPVVKVVIPGMQFNSRLF